MAQPRRRIERPKKVDDDQEELAAAIARKQK